MGRPRAAHKADGGGRRPSNRQLDNSINLFDDSQSQPSFENGLDEKEMCRGGIVHLYLKDFMTHKDVHFYPGKSVNLVCGANGTGKSAIVCAICIGLGGDANILGRSTQLQGYIRHGTKSTTIEMELFNPAGPNYKISRRINKVVKNNTTTTNSEWKIDGEKSDLTHVKTLVKDLNIQLNNLVTFMPQDRVQEFSKLDPPKLLKLTEKAIDVNLESTHEKLMGSQEEMQSKEKSISKMESEVRRQEVQIKKMGEQVAAYHEREEILSQIELKKGTLAWIDYTKILVEFTKVKTEMNSVKKKKDKIEAKAGKMSNLKRGLEDKMRTFSFDIQKRTSEKRELVRELANGGGRDLDKTLERIGMMETEFTIKREEEERRVEELRKLKEHLNAAEANYERQKNEVVSAEEIQEEMRGHRGNLEKCVNGISDLNLTIEREQNKIRESMHIKRRVDDQLAKLNEAQNAKMEFLHRHFKDVYTALEFFQANGYNGFRGEVHPPMILELDIKDINYGKIVECFVGMPDLTSFFCESPEDVGHFLDLMKRRGLRVSCYHHKLSPNWSPPTLGRIDPAIMRRYGFVKHMSDLIDAPPFYLSYLYDRANLNAFPVGPDSLLERIDEIKEHTSIRNFFTTTFTVKMFKSGYSDTICTTVDRMQSPKVFTVEINKEELGRLENEAAELDRVISIGKRGIGKMEGKLHALNTEKEAIEHALRDCDSKLNKSSSAKSTIDKLKRKIGVVESQKVDLKALLSNMKGEKKKLLLVNLASLNNLTEKGSKANRLGFVLNTRGQQVSYLKKFSESLDATSDYLKRSSERIFEEYNEIEGRVAALADQAKKKKADAAELTKTREPPEDVREGRVNEDEIRGQIDSETMRLQFLQNYDQKVIEDYEKRTRELEQMKRSMEAERSSLSSVKGRIDKVKRDWLDTLEGHLEKINRNFISYFQTLNCGGEVILDKGENPDDFRNFGIKIMVRFRADEELSELTGWKQSGGERAITTALYILALQEISRVPFRVVDEINQGMDAKNEAKFYNLLTRITGSSASLSQYFVLTPKLLPKGMTYPEDLCIQFIINGPHVQDAQVDAGRLNDGEGEEEMEEDVRVDRKPNVRDLKRSAKRSAPQEESSEEESEEEEDEDQERMDVTNNTTNGAEEESESEYDSDRIV